MSLLGIDIGTTGCKSSVYTVTGEQIALSYRDYEILTDGEGHEEFDPAVIWRKVKETIRDVAEQTSCDPVQALSVSSLGEAMVPVSEDGTITGNSILGPDRRGHEFVDRLLEFHSPSEIFRLTGNLPGTFFSLPKIAWVKKYQPELYNKTRYFLAWSDFICFMLGGVPATDHSLACRTLLFDIHKCTWSEELMRSAGLDIEKFAPSVPSGTFLGYVKEDLADQLHLGKKVAIVSGGHDQCCAVLGSGVQPASRGAMYAMGTYICVAPVFSEMPDVDSMFRNNLHIEHHVVPGSYVTYIFNQSGGALMKWYRQLFMPSCDEDAYGLMFDEITEKFTDIIVIPKFGVTGPPDFLSGGAGCISGISLSHSRGDILRASLEGISFYIRDCFEKLKGPFSKIDFFMANGGGSVSNKWLQITADILGRKMIRNRITEASSLGAAMIAGVGCNLFVSFDEAIRSMVKTVKIIYPDPVKTELYNKKFEQYKKLSDK